MTPGTQPMPRTGRTAAALRQVIGMLAVLCLVLAQAVPVGAGLSDGAPGLIEICSESGAKVIPSPDGTLPTDCDCDLCDCCLTGGFGLALVASTPPVAMILAAGADVDRVCGDLVAGLADVSRPQTRGPPETRKSENMTAIWTTRPDDNGGTAAIMGKTPCV